MALRRAGAFGLAFVMAKAADPSCDAAQLVQGSARVQPAADLNVGTTEGLLSSHELVETVKQNVCPVAEKLLGRTVKAEEVLRTMDQVNAQDTPPMDFSAAMPMPKMSEADKQFEQLQARFKTFLQEGEIVPPRAKAMSLLQEMSEKHEQPMYPGWHEDVHEALVGGQEWLRQPEVMEQFLGFLPQLRELLQKPDFTMPNRGAASLLEMGSEHSTEATAAKLVSSVGHSIQKVAAAVNSTMGQYPFKYKIDEFAPPDPLKPMKEFTMDLGDHLTGQYVLMSKQFASFDFGLHPLDDHGLQLDFTFMFENLWGPHSFDAPKWGFYQPEMIRVIPGIQLSWRNGNGVGIGAKVEMFTRWWLKKKIVTVAWAAYSTTIQRKKPVVAAHEYEAVGQIKWGGGPVLKQRRFIYDFLPKAVTPISLEHKTMWRASPAKNTWELRFSEMLKNPIMTAGMELFMWDIFADVNPDPAKPHFEQNVTTLSGKDFPEITIRVSMKLPPPKRLGPQW